MQDRYVNVSLGKGGIRFQLLFNSPGLDGGLAGPHATCVAGCIKINHTTLSPSRNFQAILLQGVALLWHDQVLWADGGLQADWDKGRGEGKEEQRCPEADGPRLSFEGCLCGQVKR